MREWILMYVVNVSIPILFAAIDKTASDKYAEELVKFIDRNVLGTQDVTCIRVWSTLESLNWPMLVRGVDQC
jgi:hypothetical protein